jgi:hypothetical protein
VAGESDRRLASREKRERGELGKKEEKRRRNGRRQTSIDRKSGFSGVGILPVNGRARLSPSGS